MAPRRRKPRRMTPEGELTAVEARAAELRELIKAKRQYSLEAVREHRRRLGINAAQYGALIAVQMGTIYGWEQGRFGPKPDQLLRWAALIKMNDKDALAPLRLEAVRRISARQVRRERERLGLTQQQYGALVGAQQATVSNWESEKKELARSSLLRLQTIWGISRAKAHRMLERGQVTRVKVGRPRLPRFKTPKPSRRWPSDPEKALASLERRAAALRPLLKLRSQFSPEATRRHRQSLGLSAGQYAKLLGVHSQCVYGWEKARFRPSPERMVRWAAVQRMSKAQARDRLARKHAERLAAAASLASRAASAAAAASIAR